MGSLFLGGLVLDGRLHAPLWAGVLPALVGLLMKLLSVTDLFLADVERAGLHTEYALIVGDGMRSTDGAMFAFLTEITGKGSGRLVLGFAALVLTIVLLMLHSLFALPLWAAFLPLLIPSALSLEFGARLARDTGWDDEEPDVILLVPAALGCTGGLAMLVYIVLVCTKIAGVLACSWKLVFWPVWFVQSALINVVFPFLFSIGDFDMSCRGCCLGLVTTFLTILASLTLWLITVGPFFLSQLLLAMKLDGDAALAHVSFLSILSPFVAWALLAFMLGMFVMYYVDSKHRKPCECCYAEPSDYSSE